jgi:hypothetical protein
METPEQVAQAAVQRAKARLVDTGMVENLRELSQDVWKGVVDRHEVELGDTHLSQSMLAVENLKTRALSRAQHNDLDPVSSHWHVDSLDVSTPSNSLTMTLTEPGDFPMRMTGFKTPVVDGRKPNFNTLVDWRFNSKARLGFALRNSNVLGGYKSPPLGQDSLFPQPTTSWTVRDFMWLWAGEETSPLTAGWLAVPVLGVTPFAAVVPLWWDEGPATAADRRDTNPTGPSYDQRTVPAPGIKIRPKADEEKA